LTSTKSPLKTTLSVREDPMVDTLLRDYEWWDLYTNRHKDVLSVSDRRDREER
jgi:hypothetical protein